MTAIFNDREIAFLTPILQRLNIPLGPNLRVDQLQAILRDLHLPHGGRRDDLIARLRQYITATETGLPTRTRGVPGMAPFTDEELDFLDPALRNFGFGRERDFP